jgi:hypothetical protein
MIENAAIILFTPSISLRYVLDIIDVYEGSCEPGDETFTIERSKCDTKRNIKLVYDTKGNRSILSPDT